MRAARFPLTSHLNASCGPLGWTVAPRTARYPLLLAARMIGDQRAISLFTRLASSF